LTAADKHTDSVDYHDDSNEKETSMLKRDGIFPFMHSEVPCTIERGNKPTPGLPMQLVRLGCAEKKLQLSVGRNDLG